MKNNYLVTGGAGFIGANFIYYLAKQKDTNLIINLDKLTYAANISNLKNLKYANYAFVQGDINNSKLLDEILHKHNINKIIHFAAESHVDRSIDHPSSFIETNIFGTFALLEAAKKYWLEEKKFTQTECLFHHVSTDEVFGSLKLNEPAFTEQHQYKPNSPYSASKAGSDHLVHAYFHTYNLPITISNCSNNYGPFQHQEKFIPTIINSCITRKNIPIYGDGTNIRDWLYVDDHCEAIYKIISYGERGQTFNIGGNNEKSNIEIAQIITSIFDNLNPSATKYSELIVYVKDRPGHDWRYAINDTKIKNQLGWQAKTNFAIGIENTIKFYLNKKTYE